MFKHLSKIMESENVSLEDLATILDNSKNAVINKLNGKSDFTLHEAQKIHLVFRAYTFDYLFAR